MAAGSHEEKGTWALLVILVIIKKSKNRDFSLDIFEKFLHSSKKIII
jgi:hypothetical protein